jgi:hypothetical protein
MNLKRTGLVGQAVVLSVLSSGIACRDSTDPAQPTDSRPVLPGPAYTAAQLDSINPMRRAGPVHNAGVAVFLRSLLKTNSIAQACETLARWASTAPELERILSETERTALATHVRQDPKCQAGRASGVALWRAVIQYPHEVSSAGMALVEDIGEAINTMPNAHALNADTLAARLSPIYSASTSLSSLDAEAVQTLISIAQSSQSSVASTWDSNTADGQAFILSCAQ